MTHASSSNHSKYPRTAYISYSNMSSSHKHFSLSISTHVEPNTYGQAMQHASWRDAIQPKLSALLKTNTWQLTPLPPTKKSIGCKWIFKVKLKADGTVERHKARLVAKSFTQTEGLDYLETFSPMVGTSIK